MKNLVRDVEHIALCLSEEGGYEYYHIDDDLKELAKNVSDMQTENAKLRELVRLMYDRMDESCAVQHPYAPAPISYDRLMQALARARDLGVEVDGWA